LQEELENRSVVLTTKATKLTARALAKLMQAALRKMKESRGKASNKPGRMSFKELSKGGTLTSIPITEDNIKAFEPVARKFGISYDLKQDVSTEPPRWLVFFRSKDTAAMEAAFAEFNKQQIKRATDRPSTREDMQKRREKLKNAVRDKTRHKHREGPEL
jgi:hypothetical protein